MGKTSLVLLLVLAAGGCDSSSAPVFAGAEPAFGPIVMNAGETLELSVRAVDATPDPATGVLFARLFVLGDSPTARVFTGQETMLSTIAGASSFAGSFFAPSGAALCRLFPGETTLYVVVADRPFSNERGGEDLAPGGRTVENHWELSCR